MNRFAFILFTIVIAACNINTKQQKQKNNETITPAYAVSDLVRKGYKGNIKHVICKEFPFDLKSLKKEVVLANNLNETYNKEGYIINETMESADLGTYTTISFISDYYYKDGILCDEVNRYVNLRGDTETISKDVYYWLTPLNYKTITYPFKSGIYDTTMGRKTEYFLDVNYRPIKKVDYTGNNTKIVDEITHTYDSLKNVDTIRIDGNIYEITVIEKRDKSGNPTEAKRYSPNGEIIQISYFYEYYQ